MCGNHCDCCGCEVDRANLFECFFEGGFQLLCSQCANESWDGWDNEWCDVYDNYDNYDLPAVDMAGDLDGFDLL